MRAMRLLSLFAVLMGTLVMVPVEVGADEPDTATGQRKNSGCRFDDHKIHPGRGGGGLRALCGTNSGTGSAKADVNGDGFSDLVIGLPNEDVNGARDAGAIQILLGGASGLTPAVAGGPASQLWTQDTDGVPDSSEAGDRWGWSVAAGDFNLDGAADVAVGAPYEDVGTAADAGTVTVLWGSFGGGLTATNPGTGAAAQLWTQDSTDVLDTVEAGDLFGFALTWGEFRNGGGLDLVIGVPGESVGTLAGAGAVNVLYGRLNDGPSATGNQLWTQDAIGLESSFPGIGASEANDHFGATLTAGDFRFDGNPFVSADLAIGVIDEDAGTTADVGAVEVLYSSNSLGLTTTNAQLWIQKPAFAGDAMEAGDRFGSALTNRDLNADSRRDLVVGNYSEDVTRGDGSVVKDAGMVTVLFGTATRLSATGRQIWTQDASDAAGNGVEDAAEAQDYFGLSVAVGDYNNDGKGDLAVGVPYEDVGSVANAGLVNVLYGGTGGLSAANDVAIDQGIVETVETGDLFGYSLSSWRFRVQAEGASDLAVGAPYEDLGDPAAGGVADAGQVDLLFGSSSGLTGGQVWTQDSAGVPDSAETTDLFGSRMY